ncbi:MAG: glycosyltransferase [Crocinitomicaceae bacterium]|jgi:glycosyltransferase involved in cell wall biosynthesis
MKITILSTFYPFRGGIAQFNALLYRVLEKRHSVQAITFKRQYPQILFPGKTQYVTENDVAEAIPSKPWLDTINPWSYWRTAMRIKREAPDVIITKYWMTFFAPSLGFVLGKQHKKTLRIAILDNVLPHERRFFDHAFNRYFLRRNDGFVVMTEKVKKDLHRYRPDAPCMLIPHPVYNQFGAKIERSTALGRLNLTFLHDKKVLLFFGIIRDYKGLDLLLNALAGLSSDYHLVIAGEAYGDFSVYQSLIDSLGIAERCHVFERYIDDQEVSSFFCGADVCVLPYKTATQSGIAGIAQHFTLPLIATPVGGLGETIAHDQNGLITEAADVESLTKAVLYYFENQKKAPFSSALEYYNAENSWESFADKLENFILNVNPKVDGN